jgi:hypothetical protein
MLPAPRLPLSSRLAAVFLAVLLLATIAGVVLPTPWIRAVPLLLRQVFCFAWMFPGLPLLVLLVNDLANQRQDRLISRHATLVPAVVVPAAAVGDAGPDASPGDEDEDDPVAADEPTLVFDHEAIAAEQLARWRRWRRWLLGIATLTVATRLAFGGWWMAVALYVLAPALVFEIYLAINLQEAMTPAVWRTLRPFERALARLYPAVLGLGAALVMLTALGALVYALATATWNVKRVLSLIAGLAMWSWALHALVAMVRHLGWMAFRRAPPAPQR